MTSPIGEASGTLLGLAAHYQMASAPSDIGIGGSEFAGNFANNEWITVTADATVNFGGASLYGALYYSNTETKWSRSTTPNDPFGTPSLLGTTNLMGLVVQGSMYVTPKWEVFARYEYLDPITLPETNNYNDSPPITFSPASILTLGTNWYLDGQDLRLPPGRLLLQRGHVADGDSRERLPADVPVDQPDGLPGSVPLQF